MLPSYTTDLLSRAENIAKTESISKTYEVLRQLPFADFCTLNLNVPAKYPYLKKLLPIMPPNEVQKKWVGDFGQNLMSRSCNIARLFQILSFKTTGTGLEGKKILDYGCGWGRLLRLMNYFTDINDIYGVDIMESSLRECHKANIPNKIELCKSMPTKLPFDNIKFDLIFSFSVFTHIPESIATSVLKAVRQKIIKNGIFIITIRSYEFWDLRENVWPAKMIKKMRTAHISEGYAFQTFNNGSDINSNYGDTTMSFDFLSNLASKTGWKVADIDRDLSEPYQIAIVLKPI